MKKIIMTYFLLLMFMIPVKASAETLKKGFYKIADTNISQNITYTVQNTSYNERIYILIFDDKATLLQGIRLKPQSSRYNLVPLKPGYKIILIGDGEIIIYPNIVVK